MCADDNTVNCLSLFSLTLSLFSPPCPSTHTSLCWIIGHQGPLSPGCWCLFPDVLDLDILSPGHSAGPLVFLSLSLICMLPLSFSSVSVPFSCLCKWCASLLYVFVSSPLQGSMVAKRMCGSGPSCWRHLKLLLILPDP